MKSLLLLALLSLVTISCRPPENKEDLSKLAREFYEAMSESDHLLVTSMYYDSIRVKEGSYASSIAKSDYVKWLEWDASFDPTYEVLTIASTEDQVIATVSKSCYRTLFLNGEPAITKEILRFKNGKILELEVSEYVLFHTEKWDAKRDSLVAWIEQSHPGLDGFIHDQTKSGATKYLTAMKLYQSESARPSKEN